MHYAPNQTRSEVSLLEILLVFLKIGAFTFGGGYVMLPIIQRELVSKKKWLEGGEFYNILVFIQGLPGPVALNCSLMAAKKLRGFKGGMMATIGIITPSILVILLIAAFFFPHFRDNYYVQAAFYGIRPAVTALVAAAAFNMGRDLIKDNYGYFILSILFVGGMWLELHPVILLVAGGLTGWLYYSKKSDGE